MLGTVGEWGRFGSTHFGNFFIECNGSVTVCKRLRLLRLLRLRRPAWVPEAFHSLWQAFPFLWQAFPFLWQVFHSLWQAFPFL